MMKKTVEEIKQLARDVLMGRVFTSSHIREHEVAIMIGSIFMPMLFMGEEEYKRVFCNKDKPVGLIFEYLTEAGPRAINGYPTFLSMQLLSREDTNLLEDYLRAYSESLNNV